MTSRQRNAIGIALSIILALACMKSCSAANRFDARVSRQNRKQHEAQIGITTVKWQVRKNRSQAVLNFSQPFRWFNPIAWFF